MKIDSISLTWFRGAAETVTIAPNGKSMVVYGENGSGKSSFVDAVEYCLHSGKIGHLAHEYSGKHQERGVLNTHTPQGRDAEIRILFADKSERITKVSRSGTIQCTGAGAAHVDSWDYRRTILRQSEVATFIQDTKGDKYSALLPLLGLHHLEIAAENIRQLRRTVESQANISRAKGALSSLEEERRRQFEGAGDDAVIERIKAVRSKYGKREAPPTDAIEICREAHDAVATRIDSFSAEDRRRITLEAIASTSLQDEIELMRECNAGVAAATEPFLTERLEILVAAEPFAETSDEEGRVVCPACGSRVVSDQFQSHISRERSRLTESSAAVIRLKHSRSRVCDSLAALTKRTGDSETKRWLTSLSPDLVDPLAYLDTLDIDALRTKCSEEDLRLLVRNVLPVIERAKALKGDAADLRDLLADRAAIETAQSLLKGAALQGEITSAETLLLFLGTLEEGVRAEIRQESQAVIDSLSTDIQRMWAILHPGEAILDVRLRVPEDADKAIDIPLNFYGVLQESPRLTLSEGHRNSLGLCIFLAMAKRGVDQERPLFLDDVVISLDRNHRGMIVELLEREFRGRQIFLLTHEREWYSELRQQLDGSEWSFAVLMPYDAPEIGIRVSDRKSAAFDEARALIRVSPDSAGNTVRKLMDIELAVRATRMKLPLPYLHREKNDHRVAHDFLAAMISNGPRCFQRKEGASFVSHSTAIDAFREADRLLVSWGNRASHTFDVVKNEVERLMTACEVALTFFDCPACKRPVFQTDDSSGEYVQCRCGDLRWRYGKT